MSNQCKFKLLIFIECKFEKLWKANVTQWVTMKSADRLGQYRPTTLCFASSSRLLWKQSVPATLGLSLELDLLTDYSFHQSNGFRTLQFFIDYLQVRHIGLDFKIWTQFVYSSPSGKLVQIEYALSAVAAGAPSVGIKGMSSCHF